VSAWTADELGKIGNAEELEIATSRADGSLSRRVTIWVVRYGDDLYVRAVNGRDAAWFRGAQDRHEGRIEAGGVAKDVRLMETDELSDEIDAAYRAKYHRYASNIVESTTTPQARAATLQLVPRAAGV
jgi:hypothetical protein